MTCCEPKDVKNLIQQQKPKNEDLYEVSYEVCALCFKLQVELFLRVSQTVVPKLKQLLANALPVLEKYKHTLS